MNPARHLLPLVSRAHPNCDTTEYSGGLYPLRVERIHARIVGLDSILSKADP